MKANAGPDLWTESSKAIGLDDIRKMSLSEAGETLKDIFFPAVCPVCMDAVPIERRMAVRRLKRRIAKNKDTGSGKHAESTPKRFIKAMYPAYICRECLEELKLIKAPYCRKCGKQLELKKADRHTDKNREDTGLCNDCAKKERSFVQTRCIITYDETAQEIMAGLKYKSKKEYAALLSILAADRLSDWINDISPDIIIPVPIHKERLLKRGYNQAELIARGISELTNIPVNTRILSRTKNTRAQKELDADERLHNLLGAFAADIKISHNDKGNAENAGRAGTAINQTVLLIDDIYTTGATLEACTTALLHAGIGKVYGLCICAGEDAPRVQIIRK